MSNKNRRLVKFRAKCFEAYGLNSYRNFLSAPDCECGCGGKMQPVIDNEDELFQFMYMMLADNDCTNCAIFAHGYNDTMYATIKTGDIKAFDNEEEPNQKDDPVDFYGIEETDMNFFKEFDAEFCLHCYGLLIQGADGAWTIVED